MFIALLFVFLQHLICAGGSWLPNEAVEYFVRDFEKLELYRQARTILNSEDDRSSAPFITGNGFMHIANFVVAPGSIINVQENDCIFISRGYYPMFIQNFLTRINASYTLIVHNGDESTPDSQNDTRGYRFDKVVTSQVLSEEFNKGHLRALYTANLWLSNYNLANRPGYFNCLPIGLENRNYIYGRNLNQYITAMKSNSIPNHLTNKGLLLVSFTSNSMDRIKVLSRLEKTVFYSNDTWYNRTLVSHSNWLKAITEHKFVLAPFGNGLDTHRMYEIWLMGGIPVARKSTISSCYIDEDSATVDGGSLPIVYLDSWDQLTKERLEEEWHRIMKVPSSKWNWKRLTLDYWKEKLNCPVRNTQKIELELINSIGSYVNAPAITLNYSSFRVVNSNRLSIDGIIKYEEIITPLVIESKHFSHPDTMIDYFKDFCRIISRYSTESINSDLCHYAVCGAAIEYLEPLVDTLQITSYEKRQFINQLKLASGWNSHFQYLEGNQTAVIFNIGEVNLRNYREYIFGCIATFLKTSTERDFFVLYIGINASPDVLVLVNDFILQYTYLIRIELVAIANTKTSAWNHLIDVASRDNQYFILINGYSTLVMSVTSITDILAKNPVLTNFGVVYIPISKYSMSLYKNKYFPPIVCFHRKHLQIFKAAFPSSFDDYSDYSFSWILDVYSVFNSSLMINAKVNTKSLSGLSAEKEYDLSSEFLRSYIDSVTSAQRKVIKLFQITKNDIAITNYLSIQFYCDMWDNCLHYYTHSGVDNYLGFIFRSMDTYIRYSYDEYALSQPLLWHYIKKSKKPVLRLGAGDSNSAIILHAYTKRHNIELVTFDDDVSNLSPQLSIDPRFHKMVLLEKCDGAKNCWSQLLSKVETIDWGLVIVNRKVVIDGLSEGYTDFTSADYIIIDGNHYPGMNNSSLPGNCEYHVYNGPFSHKSYLVPIVCSKRYSNFTHPRNGELENDFMNYINYLIDF